MIIFIGEEETLNFAYHALISAEQKPDRQSSEFLFDGR